jgi:hypothetical protein
LITLSSVLKIGVDVASGRTGSLLRIFLLLLTSAFFSAHANPFKINFPQKKDLTYDEYIEVQKQIRQIDILPLVRDMYASLNGAYFTTFDDIASRCTKCIRQTLIDPANGLYPQKGLVKIGRGSDNCFVCCGPFNGKYPYYVKSLIETLERQGFDGFFLYYIGGWPNPTGEEIQYTAVPYCFKIFAMVEAHQMGFNKVLWVDAACLPLGDVQPLFDRIDKDGALLNWFRQPSSAKRYIFPQTHDLLFNLTGTDVHEVPYINTIVFGLKMNTPEARRLVKMFYEFVRLGTPFLSCFPEEWVLTAIIGKRRFRDWTKSHPPKLVRGSANGADDSPAELSKLREKGVYFFQRKGR